VRLSGSFPPLLNIAIVPPEGGGKKKPGSRPVRSCHTIYLAIISRKEKGELGEKEEKRPPLIFVRGKKSGTLFACK